MSQRVIIDVMARSKILPLKVDASPAVTAPQAVGLKAAERFFTRDLSWLAFNDRVLSEAADATVPALERLRFATIVSSNLDEFFMTRVAEIGKIARRSASHRFLDGMTARQVLAQIREHALRQKSRQAEILRDILAAMRAEGIEILADFLDERAPDAEVQERLPTLKVMVRRYPEPPTALASERLHVFVRFPREYAVITIVDREGRLWVALPGDAGEVTRLQLFDRDGKLLGDVPPPNSKMFKTAAWGRDWLAVADEDADGRPIIQTYHLRTTVTK